MAMCPAKTFIIQEKSRIDTREITSHLGLIRDIFLATAQTQWNSGSTERDEFSALSAISEQGIDDWG